ncbi:MULTISPECIES: hypothetical protein [Galbibacter]|uniref:Uncharacterized protein n=1 Tax=Galbibacter pacificus TaxID=2996052 RepID=A0ABT6FUF8_9FLAO|nr:hypothetical protein [Galbibacter pacificus]MDG3583654.1 hypothetical protein [Galbibacter pacificus]MDG3586870.1 hypothetical protein [Galbibacter pacificus]
MKTVIQIVLWLLSIFFAYQIYTSVMGPIKFDKVKKERYSAVIDKLKDIRDAQEAYRTVTGKFAKDFPSLIKFIDTAQYTLTQQRDSSYMEYDETYRIDMEREVKVIDTLGFVPVKDSLFGGSDSYKNLATVPYAENNEKFTMDAKMINANGFNAPVFEVKVNKSVLLYDQPKDLVDQEKSAISVEEVNGPEIKVGSLTEVSTSANWPPYYDTKKE